MKIVFMGTPDYATTILDELVKQKIEVCALFTQPDKPVGRKQIITAPHIKQYCIDNNLSIPIFQPNTLMDQAVVDSIKTLDPDFIIVAAYGQILPKEVLDIAPCINLHASLLPKYRGASPIQEAILNDDEYTGVTAMLMDVGLDSGDILAFQYQKISSDILVQELFQKLSIIAAKLTITTLNNFTNILPKKQNLSEVSHCKKIKKQDGQINFDDAKKIYLKYKAYNFWPGIYLDSGLKLIKIELHETQSKNDVTIITQIETDYIIVTCKYGSLKIYEVQPSSKKAMNVIDYIRGKRLEIGSNLS